MSLETIEKALPDPSDICVKCGRSWHRLMVLAMFVDAGAFVSPSPLKCDHEFDSETQ